MAFRKMANDRIPGIGRQHFAWFVRSPSEPLIASGRVSSVCESLAGSASAVSRLATE